MYTLQNEKRDYDAGLGCGKARQMLQQGLEGKLQGMCVGIRDPRHYRVEKMSQEENQLQQTLFEMPNIVC